MITEDVICRVFVIKPYGNDDDVSLAEKSARPFCVRQPGLTSWGKFCRSEDFAYLGHLTQTIPICRKNLCIQARNWSRIATKVDHITEPSA
jgi:hypothetical protein